MAGHYPSIFKSLPPFNGQFDAYKLQAQACDVLFANYPANTSIPTHSHDTHNYGVITRGELILTVDGETSRYGVGDWYHIPANIQHTARFEMETDEIEFWFKRKPED